MGARGALKIPQHLAAVPDDAAVPTAADQVQPLAPAKPQAVEDNDDLSALWDLVVPELDRVGLLALSDGPAIEMALRHFLLARRASDDVTDIAVADHHNGGTMKKNPAEAVFRAESEMFLKYAQQLGMTFVSRARTPVAKGAGEDANPFAQGG